MIDFSKIKILFCAPGTLRLYGIPYDMRADVGQTPGHLWRSRVIPDPIMVARGHHGAVMEDPGPRPDWIALDEDDPEVAAFLAGLGDRVPGNPYEWAKL